MTPKHPEVEVRLIGLDGNALVIIGRCTRAARDAGVPDAAIDAFTREAMATKGYDAFLRVCRAWFACDRPRPKAKARAKASRGGAGAAAPAEAVDHRRVARELYGGWAKSGGPGRAMRQLATLPRFDAILVAIEFLDAAAGGRAGANLKARIAERAAKGRAKAKGTNHEGG